MLGASSTSVVQGREVSGANLEQIRELIRAHPDWSRRRLSEVLAAEWDWRNAAGRLKDMAARSLLVKLEQREWIQLPPRRWTPTNRMRAQVIAPRLWDRRPLPAALAGLGPLEIHEVSGDAAGREVLAAALAEFHYLGHGGTVGENAQYLVRQGSSRVLAAVLFGSAAWKCRDRDRLHAGTDLSRTPRGGDSPPADGAVGRAYRRLVTTDLQRHVGDDESQRLSAD